MNFLKKSTGQLLNVGSPLGNRRQLRCRSVRRDPRRRSHTREYLEDYFSTVLRDRRCIDQRVSATAAPKCDRIHLETVIVNICEGRH